MTRYEFEVNNLCKTYTYKQLAELYLNMKGMYAVLKADNSNLRSENETLRYLIAKYGIEKENSGE